MKSVNSRNGFTLIELSIVLVILGLIIATVAPLFVSLSKKNKLSDARQIVSTARDELKGDIFRLRTVPADLSNVGHSFDPWQNALVYIPAPNLVGQNICTWLAAATNQTGLAVCLDGDCVAGKKGNIAFIVASIGSNFNRQMEAPANRDTVGADREVRLYGYGTEIDQYTVAPDPNRASDQFDDIVEYVSVAEIIERISCSVSVTNLTGQTVCSGGAAVADGGALGILDVNQLLAVGSTTDNCLTIDSTCTINHAAAQNSDTDMDQAVRLTSAPPACTLQDM